VEHSKTEATEGKAVHGVKKKPYAKPTLTVHGDVEKITEILRLACAKGGGTLSGDVPP
jgi:hypothetical protein